MSGDRDLAFKRRIPGQPHQVYDAWTRPEVMRRWLAPGANKVLEASTDVRIGGRFRIRSVAPDGTMHTIDGAYRELDPGRRIVMTWSYSGPVELLCEMETLLAVDLTPLGDDETEMTVTQTRIATLEAAAAYSEGWPTCFAKLEGAFASKNNNDKKKHA
jgi:uncharacterized protein YndB with AHSA1/START domain